MGSHKPIASANAPSPYRSSPCLKRSRYCASESSSDGAAIAGDVEKAASATTAARTSSERRRVDIRWLGSSVAGRRGDGGRPRGRGGDLRRGQGRGWGRGPSPSP